MNISNVEIGMSVIDTSCKYVRWLRPHDTISLISRSAERPSGNSLIGFGVDSDVNPQHGLPSGEFFVSQYNPDTVIYDPNKEVRPNGLILRLPLIRVLRGLETEGAKFFQVTSYDFLEFDLVDLRGKRRLELYRFRVAAERMFAEMTGMKPEHAFKVEGEMSLSRLLAGERRPADTLKIGRFDLLADGLYRAGFVQGPVPVSSWRNYSYRAAA